MKQTTILAILFVACILTIIGFIVFFYIYTKQSTKTDNDNDGDGGIVNDAALKSLQQKFVKLQNETRTTNMNLTTFVLEIDRRGRVSNGAETENKKIQTKITNIEDDVKKKLEITARVEQAAIEAERQVTENSEKSKKRSESTLNTITKAKQTNVIVDNDIAKNELETQNLNTSLALNDDLVEKIQSTEANIENTENDKKDVETKVKLVNEVVEQKFKLTEQLKNDNLYLFDRINRGELESAEIGLRMSWIDNFEALGYNIDPTKRSLDELGILINSYAPISNFIVANFVNVKIDGDKMLFDHVEGNGVIAIVTDETTKTGGLKTCTLLSFRKISKTNFSREIDQTETKNALINITLFNSWYTSTGENLTILIPLTATKYETDSKTKNWLMSTAKKHLDDFNDATYGVKNDRKTIKDTRTYGIALLTNIITRYRDRVELRNSLNDWQAYFVNQDFSQNSVPEFYSYIGTRRVKFDRQIKTPSTEGRISELLLV